MKRYEQENILCSSLMPSTFERPSKESFIKKASNTTAFSFAHMFKNKGLVVFDIAETTHDHIAKGEKAFISVIGHSVKEMWELVVYMPPEGYKRVFRLNGLNEMNPR